MTDTPTDWRGTPITPGRTVIYGAGVGRSIALVEATVEGFTKSGRVNVRIVRRAYGGASADVVHVGADRLTIVDALPAAEVPTAAEEREQWRIQLAEYERNRATHQLERPHIPDVGPRGSERSYTYVPEKCVRCDMNYAEASQTECPNAVD